jgi:hypothetical protein
LCVAARWFHIVDIQLIAALPALTRLCCLPGTGEFQMLGLSTKPYSVTVDAA